MKECSKCNETKQLTEFNKSSKTKDGRRQQCRNCEKEYRMSKDIKQQRYERDLLNKYGLTIDSYNTMFTEQKGCCKVCSIHQSKLKRPLAVDHNHNTGEVRGLLCDRCNRALGLFGDSPFLLESALEYLKEEGHYGD